MIFSKDDRRHVPATGPLGRGKRNLRSAALALALAVVTAAPASASVAYDTITNWRLQWYPAWGYLTSSASATVQWTWNPWTGHKVAQITSGSAYSRSTFGPGCLRVKAEAFYCGILGYQVEWRPDADNLYLRVYVARLREKIEADPARPVSLITEPAVGYRFVVGSVVCLCRNYEIACDCAPLWRVYVD